MTFEEKVKLLSGTSDEMHIPGIERLKIPSLKFSDGPLGVRCWGKSTAYPCGSMLAATWDVDAAKEMGEALGRDSRARGVHILLGPGVDLYRVAQCGRNFEYFGEDPFLSARLAVAWIQGVQAEGVATSVKHFAANDQETLRDSVDTIVSERRLQEICFPPFKAAVKEANAATVMAAYNKLNGDWCTANKSLLTDVLRNQWGFEGVLMSDWGAVHELLKPIDAGTDLEMGKTLYYSADKIKQLIDSGKITQKQVDEHARRVIRMMVTMGFLDREQLDKTIPLDDPRSAAAALKVATEGLVLLKNQNNLLPLSRSSTKNIVVLGPNACPEMVKGGGSSETEPFKGISVLDAIKETAEYHHRTGPSTMRFSWGKADPQFTSDEKNLITRADAVIASVGLNKAIECEGYDHAYDLPSEQVQLINNVAKLNSRVIAVLNAGGNVGMKDWVDDTAALLHAWYPGQNGNKAVAGVLFGDINPSGRLPDTFEAKWEDSPAFGNYPGDSANGGRVTYAEGIYVGYRSFDKRKLAPRYPFGYGLSYSTFSLDRMAIKGTMKSPEVLVDVKNTSKIKGATVVQLYVRPIGLKTAQDRPFQELKGFKRVELEPGESRSINFVLNKDSFATYDESAHKWTSPDGEYEIALGFSSRDI
ncbi:unnamed protein product, partial [Sphagnum balticum]